MDIEGLEIDINDVETKEKGARSSYPAIQKFIKEYAQVVEGNDTKAIKNFKFFEPLEAKRRLEQELISVRDEEFSQTFLINQLGRVRASRFGGYEKWAQYLLRVLASESK